MAREAGQRPRTGTLTTCAVIAFLTLPYTGGAEAAQHWLGPVGAFFAFVFYAAAGAAFFAATYAASRVLGPALPGPTCLRAVMLGSLLAALALLALLLLVLLSQKRSTSTLDADDILDVDDDN